MFELDYANYKIVNRLMKKLEQSFEEMEMSGSRDRYISRANLFYLFQEEKRYYRHMQEMPFAVLEKSDPYSQKDAIPNCTCRN